MLTKCYALNTSEGSYGSDPLDSSLWRPVSTCTESGRLMNWIPETERAYIAGLFDGEGSIHFKRGIERKRNTRQARLSYFKLYAYQHGNNHDRLFCTCLGPRNSGCGTLRSKTVKGKRKDGTKYLPQWKWRCTFRDAYWVCLLIWPWSHVKLEKIHK